MAQHKNQSGHAAGHGPAGGHGAEGSHAGGMGRYFTVYGLLILFTILTVVTGKMDLGAANIYIAMAIASTKASLVVLFFMHLWDEGPVNRLIFVTSIVFVLVMFLGIFGDLMTRAPSVLPNGGPIPIGSSPALHAPAGGGH